ncbi:murein biosynthesis integral membrane protein MurJ, partial [Streptomyces sp. GC420]|nr:murein biosynthesis integral membrane protein MurJ [Streptomyces sp. GC420]
MNAPYDGDRAQGGGGAVPPHAQNQVPPQPAPATDPYVQQAYDQDPYQQQDLTARDPVAEALYDRAAHPPPPPGTYAEPRPIYR